MAPPKLNREAEAAPLEALLAPFADAPEKAAILLDVDGTLAPIVDDPAAAAVPAETRALLAELDRRYGLVACISGRRARDARRTVGLESLTYVGNHGLELLAPGAKEPVTAPSIAPLARRVGDFASEAQDAKLTSLGVRLEDKDAIWAFHWRGAPDERAAEEALRAVAERARESGLVPHWGRKVLEIRPPSGADKGAAVETVLSGHPVDRALYAGDDTTDLDAFRKLRELEAAGRVAALCVGVSSAEGPEQIVAESDAVVDGPRGVVEMLERLNA